MSYTAAYRDLQALCCKKTAVRRPGRDVLRYCCAAGRFFFGGRLGHQRGNPKPATSPAHTIEVTAVPARSLSRSGIGTGYLSERRCEAIRSNAILPADDPPSGLRERVQQCVEALFDLLAAGVELGVGAAVQRLPAAH